MLRFKTPLFFTSIQNFIPCSPTISNTNFESNYSDQQCGLRRTRLNSYILLSTDNNLTEFGMMKEIFSLIKGVSTRRIMEYEETKTFIMHFHLTFGQNMKIVYNHSIFKFSLEFPIM